MNDEANFHLFRKIYIYFESGYFESYYNSNRDFTMTFGIDQLRVSQFSLTE